MPHLERDWAIDQQQYDELQHKVQSAAELVDRLRRDPRSWDNLKFRTKSEAEGPP